MDIHPNRGFKDEKSLIHYQIQSLQLSPVSSEMSHEAWLSYPLYAGGI